MKRNKFKTLTIVLIFGLFGFILGALTPFLVPPINNRYHFWYQTHGLRQKIASNPEDPHYYSSLAAHLSLYGKKYIGEIIKLEEKLLELHPEYSSSYFNLAQMLSLADVPPGTDWERYKGKIVSLVEEGASLAPKSDLYTIARAGRILDRIGEDEKAYEYYQKALSFFHGDTATFETVSPSLKTELIDALEKIKSNRKSEK